MPVFDYIPGLLNKGDPPISKRMQDLESQVAEDKIPHLTFISLFVFFSSPPTAELD